MALNHWENEVLGSPDCKIHLGRGSVWFIITTVILVASGFRGGSRSIGFRVLGFIRVYRGL